LKHFANKIELRKQADDEKQREIGRLCLLVHDLEQFIVNKVVQSFPYSVLDVQILPDLGEELPEGLVDENSGKMTGGAAVRRSFEYHEYEFDNVQLPMARDATACQRTPSKHPSFPVYCHLPFILPTTPPWMVPRRSPLLLRIQDYLVEGPCWKTNLRAGEFSPNPPLLPDSDGPKTADLDVLETLLWLAVESLCHNTRFLVPEEVRCLVPPHMNYLDIQPAKCPV
jgi:hypothetical protein